MTKRKATNSLDEWLTERRVVSETPNPVAEIPSEPISAAPQPTAEASQLQLTSEPVSGTLPVEVDITEEVAAEWFWSLLDQCGFERW